MMKEFSFRIETNADGVEIIDPRQSTEFDSLNLKELRRYLEVENSYTIWNDTNGSRPGKKRADASYYISWRFFWG